MKLLIVDDEAPARAKLRRQLQGLPGVTAVFEAAGAAQALELLAREAVDAALLDIQMPGMSGLALAAELPAGVPCAFSTAYDAHAVQAFELNAVDYLLKPYTAERLAEAVQRLQQRCEQRAAARGSLVGALCQLQPVAGHWLVERRGSLYKLALTEVQWVATADNYIELHAPPHCDLDRRTLAAFLAHPATAGFVRVHRFHAVNTQQILSVTPLPHGEAMLTLIGGQTLRVSRSYRGRLG